MAVQVDQSRAQAGGNIAGRDISNTTIITASREAGVVEKLLERLHSEMKHDQRACETIERLKRFYVQRAHDGVIGLPSSALCGGINDSAYISTVSLRRVPSCLKRALGEDIGL